jgi:hypothetical protein
MAAERQAARLASSAGVKVPRPLAVLGTLAALEAAAALGFFPPAEVDTDLAGRFAQAATANMEWAAALPGRLRRRG